MGEGHVQLVHDLVLADRARDGCDLPVGWDLRDEVVGIEPGDAIATRTAGEYGNVQQVGIVHHCVHGGPHVMGVELTRQVPVPGLGHRRARPVAGDGIRDLLGAGHERGLVEVPGFDATRVQQRARPLATHLASVPGGHRIPP